MDVLVAATGNGARAMGLDSTGTVTAGAVADLVVLDADPLADVANARRTALVVRRERSTRDGSWSTGSRVGEEAGERSARTRLMP
jgi:imidazolonepropionase-like amidohydrolase